MILCRERGLVTVTSIWTQEGHKLNWTKVLLDNPSARQKSYEQKECWHEIHNSMEQSSFCEDGSFCAFYRIKRFITIFTSPCPELDDSSQHPCPTFLEYPLQYYPLGHKINRAYKGFDGQNEEEQCLWYVWELYHQLMKLWS